VKRLFQYYFLPKTIVSNLSQGDVKRENVEKSSRGTIALKLTPKLGPFVTTTSSSMTD